MEGGNCEGLSKKTRRSFAEFEFPGASGESPRMSEMLPRSTGMDARFDQELAAEIPGWRSEFGFPADAHARKPVAQEPAPAEARSPAAKAVPARATGLEARFEAEMAESVPGWRTAGSVEDVCHNITEQRFELAAGVRLAVVDYQLAGERLIVTHTFVPADQRGKGIAERLVTAAMEYAREKGLKVVPQCSYVDTFLRRHAEFADLRAE
jgi:uncharacterized protein